MISTKMILAGCALVLLLAGCTGPEVESSAGGTDSPGAFESAAESTPVPINADLDLESLLPAFGEVTLPSGGVASSDGTKAAIITNPYGTVSPEFGLRSCDSIEQPPYWPTVVDAEKRTFRDEGGKQIINLAVTRLESDQEASAVMTTYIDLLNFCAAHSGPEFSDFNSPGQFYDVEESVIIDDANHVYGIIYNNDVNQEVRYSVLGPYFIYAGILSPSTGDDAIALISDVRSRVAG